ncbi:bacitracin ABC transporter ATP-binding protein [Caldalkalibacillus thermarum]|uniref:ABC transporter ATP-binding protein n=1 Tax=Caldalkalibacillus thermarum TaxID=296745 RepID=UPI00166E92F0|nr:ABC transporter ATP-binding protein [Caldalkalibacillus thermarum]GGK31013.1 bacitracin ABC transporter ATP-binding protein [Caldalkalibacillus thermarum]
MSNEPLIQVEQAGKAFLQQGQMVRILNNISFQVDQGQFVSLIGPSGCGKSTLLNMVAGIVPCDWGRITVAGQQVTRPGKDRGMVFQNHALFPWMTVWKNVFFALESTQPHLDRPALEAQTRYYLELVGLLEAKDKKPSALSGGMKQRVGLARALAIQPKVLLLDEPFGALDALTRAELQDELARICQETRVTVLMVTHDIEEAILLSDRIMVMKSGPGAEIIQDLEVPLPRPRHREQLLDHPEFISLKRELVRRLSHNPDGHIR